MNKPNCPKCGSFNTKFEMRSAGTRAKSNYYRTGIKNSWIIPAGQKTYKSKRKYKSMCLCQNCGYLWTPPNPGDIALGKFVVSAFYIIVYLALIVAVFSKEATSMSYRIGYAVVILLMTVPIYKKVRRFMKKE